MSDLVLYGLKTCDSCRKARTALEGAGHRVAFHDVRAMPLDSAQLRSFLSSFGEALLNTRSTTWRGLSDTARKEPPLALLEAHPALMKRPVIDDGLTRTLGWSAETRAHWGI